MRPTGWKVASGIRLFDGLDASAIAFEPDRVVGSKAVSHIRYRVTVTTGLMEGNDA